jgi:hypothetical protein
MIRSIAATAAAVTTLLASSFAFAQPAAVPLDAPSGRLGAGLGMKSPSAGRAWADLGVFTGSPFGEFGGDANMTIWAPTFGAGFMVARSLELELLLPAAYVTLNIDSPYGSSSESASGVGNIYAGLNYVSLQRGTRLKLGGGIGLPTAETSGSAAAAAVYPVIVDAYQQSYLRIPGTLGIVAIGRVEGGDVVVPSLDVDLALLVATKKTGDFRLQDDAEAITTVAPGIGVKAADPLLVGIRAPLFVALTGESNDRAQFSLEPFVRGQIGSGFLDARFTMPIDEPLGFAFDAHKAWGLHLGGGIAF